MKAKIKTWIHRYLPSEFFAVIGALSGGYLFNTIFNNPVLTALGGTWGENTGYYGSLVIRDTLKNRPNTKNLFRAILRTLRNLFLEFGVSEYLDGFFVRPFAMYTFSRLLNNLALGLIIGKLAADMIFYIPTIISYELRTKILGE